MVIERIEIEGFKSIYEPLILDFNDIKGLWRIGGDVGAGKTTIGEAIIWGLFGDVRNKTIGDLISWRRKWCKVELDCTCRGHRIHIHRKAHRWGNQSEFDVTVDGGPLVFTNKRDAQQQLETEYYDVSKMTMDLLCIISFNNFKSLATLNTRDTKEFLDQVFGFHVLTNYVNICKDLRKGTEQDIAGRRNDVGRLEAQITRIKDLRNKERIDGDINEVGGRLKGRISAKQDAVKKYKDMIDGLSAETTRLRDAMADTKAVGSNVAKEIKLMEAGKCPTCGADINTDGLPSKRKEREVLIARWNEQDAAVKDLNKKRDEVIQERDNIIKDIDREIGDLRVLKARLEDQARRENIGDDEIRGLVKDMEDGKVDLLALEKDNDEWGRLMDILSTDVRQHILRSFIPRINHHIGEFTQQLQLPYTVEFDEDFGCSIRLFPIDQPVSLSSLSTGQLKSVDICIILGVLKSIMKGCNFNCLFLDELFSNLHGEMRDMMCKVLRDNIDEGQTIFVISHGDMDGKWFDGVIKANLEYRTDGMRGSKYTINKH